MKLRILLLIVVGAAGVGASYALAASGNHGGKHDSTVTTGTTGTATTPSCQRAHVLGTTSAPQTFTVTVTKSGEHGFAPGQVVTVTVGTSGQTVMVAAEGCVNGSTLSARGVGILAVRPMKPEHTTSTHTTTTGTTSTQTTTTGWHGKGGHHHSRR